MNPLTDEELRAAMAEVPPVSAVVQRLLAVLQDPRSDVDDVARLVRTETALSAQVLRLANSAVFGSGGRVDSIHEAVQRLGVVEVQRLVTALGSRQIFLRPLASYAVRAEALWEHSLAVAAATEACARYAGADRATAYTSGILHAVGVIALDRVATSRGLAPRPSGATTREWELGHFGEDNATVAGRVLCHWGVPGPVAATVRGRYEPDTPDAARLHLGAFIAERVGAGLPGEAGAFRATAERLNQAGVALADFSEAEPDVRQALDRARALLRLA